MLRNLLLYLSDSQAARQWLTSSPLGRRLAARFIAGETMADALRVVRQLNDEGFVATLDYLGENVREPRQAAEAADVYLNLLDRLAEEKAQSHVSVKLTQLGLALREDLARAYLARIVQRASLHKIFVRIDMEGSACTESTLRILRQIDAARDTLGVAIQAYLNRSEKDIEDLIRERVRVRLVKGAYKEPPDIAFPSKTEVDRNFARLMRKLLASGEYHAIATHDSRMIAATEAYARELGLGHDRFEFQMLYGIRRQLQRQLRARSYTVRVYVPFGRQWYGYLTRRLAERPANLLFLVRNLFRG
jgi:proline dehydrogenase